MSGSDTSFFIRGSSIGTDLPVGVVVDDGRENFPLVKFKICGDEVEDDPVPAVRFDPVFELSLV